MFKMFSKAALLSLALPAYGAVHEALSDVPFGWTKSPATISEGTTMKLQVALNYQNLDKLESMLASVSDPASSTYGHYIDIDNQTAIFAPSKESESKVKAWLSSSGARNIQSDGSIVSFTTTLGGANKMLNTEFNMYHNGNTAKLRTLGYSIPDSLVDHVDFIEPTTYFGGLRRDSATFRIEASRTATPPPTNGQLNPSCQTSVTLDGEPLPLLSPLCLKQLYNTLGYKPDPKFGSNIAFGNFLNQSASYSDLAKFERIFKIPSQNFTVLALINGGVDNQDPFTEQDGEANLDAQNIIGLIEGLPVYAYITGGSPPFIAETNPPNNQNEPYLQYYQYLLSQPNSKLPHVISNSYGDHEDTVPVNYAKRVCNQIGLLGLRGRTVFHSSGDEGVGAVCRNNVGKKQVQFTPQFPGTCPYVTTVGGTQSYNPEVAWNASSGGFSFYFRTPWYQKQAVNTYLTKYISPSTRKYYSSNNYTDFSGRGFPDISAHSLYPYYLTVIGGVPQGNGGTSAAAPVVAAIFALLNDARFRAGRPAIGFANPWLYGSARTALNDITSGGAIGCNGVDAQNGDTVIGGGIIPYASWNATVGWDPVTGLGTPDFQKLKQLSLQLPGGYGAPPPYSPPPYSPPHY